MKENPTEDDGRKVITSIADLTIEDAPLLAEVPVKAARDCGMTLDYSPSSLRLIDEELLRCHTEGRANKLVVLALACYVGEVIIRNLGGSWLATTDLSEASREQVGQLDEIPFPMVVMHASNILSNPMTKCFKRVDDGEADSVEALYYTVAGFV